MYCRRLGQVHTLKRAFSFKQTKSSITDNQVTLTKPLNQIRNIAIIAHIDAGKTTTSERMLYYAGQIALPGEVHHGNTVMDYMEQERKRGITIRAATVAFLWEQHQINLIDTPGHVDFNAEVERSLRVCDGAVAIFDGMMGVETQSESVWQQANKFKIPRIALINKMDRVGCQIETTINSVKRRLKVDPILINVPSSENQLQGLIDLTQKLYIDYSQDEMGKIVTIEEIDKQHRLFEKMTHYREIMISQLANYCDEMADLYLGDDLNTIEQDQIDQAIRKAVKSQKAVALLCGSALKNKGIQPLLDGVIKYLPSPEQVIVTGTNHTTGKTETIVPKSKGKLCALAFKVVNDKEKGPVTFFRVYSGILKNRMKIKNATLNENERISGLFRVKADETQILSEIAVGDIGAIIGCKNVRSGDTIIEETDPDRLILEGVKMPPPVFFCSIEAENSREQTELEVILQNLSREDPSLNVKVDQQTGQLLVSGQGELHLEILRDRIELEYKLKAELGQMRVAYRESVGKTHELEFVLDKQVGGASMYAKLVIRIESTIEEYDMSEIQKQRFERSDDKNFQMSEKSFSLDDQQASNELSNLAENNIILDYQKLQPVSERVRLEGDEYDTGNRRQNKNDSAAGATMEIFKSLDSLPIECVMAIQEAIQDSLMSGSLIGYPIVNTRVRIIDGRWSNIRSRNPFIFKQAASQLMKQLLKESQPCLLEPLMSVEITLPDHIIGDVLADISGKRGGRVLGIKSIMAKFFDTDDQQLDQRRKCLNALIPLSEMVGYTTYLRSISKGEAQFVMNFSHYESLSGQKQADVMSNPLMF